MCDRHSIFSRSPHLSAHLGRKGACNPCGCKGLGFQSHPQQKLDKEVCRVQPWSVVASAPIMPFCCMPICGCCCCCCMPMPAKHRATTSSRHPHALGCRWKRTPGIKESVGRNASIRALEDPFYGISICSYCSSMSSAHNLSPMKALFALA